MKKLLLVLFLLLCSSKAYANESHLDIDNINHKFYQFKNNKIENSDIYTKLGISLSEAGTFEKAIEHFNIAITLNSNNDSAYYNLAICYTKMKKTDLAIENFEKCNNLNSNYKALINIGALYADKGMYDQSIKYFELAKILNQKDIILFHNLGLIYGIKGEYQKAIENFKQVIALDPDNKNAYYNLGITYQQIGNNDLAIENLNKSINRN
jgi:tetratricopeptide (TPR) repeat protein